MRLTEQRRSFYWMYDNLQHAICGVQEVKLKAGVVQWNLLRQ